MIIPIRIEIKIGEFRFEYNINYEIKIEDNKIVPIEIHPEDLNKDSDEGNEL
jgi:hypothetical protein